jgi:16S rRNA (uracil1498-N3)-methyltransferase
LARIRLFVEAPLEQGAALALDGARAHYLANVMRLKAGDAVLLFNGRDGEFSATLTDVGRRGVALAAGPLLRPQPPPATLALLVAALKRDALDLVARAATELGVGRILPVFTARTNAGRVGTARLAAIAIEAAEQCGRCDIPAIAEPEPLFPLLERWRSADRLVLADEGGTAPPALAALAGAGPAAGVLVGPEGGFTGGELDALRVRAFVTPVSLGPNILRAETAAIAALALVQAAGGAWR